MGAAAGAGDRPRRIGQIALVVQDVDRATAFYRDVVGLEFLFRAPPGLAFFRCGEVRLMLSLPEADAGAGAASNSAAKDPDATDPKATDPDPNAAGPASLEAAASILYYDVEDLGGAHRRLADAGADVVQEPHVVHRTEETELAMGFYRDSEGNFFALMNESLTAAEARP